MEGWYSNDITTPPTALHGLRIVVITGSIRRLYLFTQLWIRWLFGNNFGLITARYSALLTLWENADEKKDVERDISELPSVFTRDFNYLCIKISYSRRVAAINPSVCLETPNGGFCLHGSLKGLANILFYYAGHGLSYRAWGKSVLSSFSMKSHRLNHSGQSPLTKKLSSGGAHYSHQDQNDREVWTRSKINFSTLMKQSLERLQYAVLYLMDCYNSSAVAMESRKEVYAALVSKLWTKVC